MEAGTKAKIGAIGDAFKDISNATSAATGNKVEYKYEGKVGNGNVVSDENCKDSDCMKKKFSDAVANIDAYLFKYKLSAQNKYGADDNKHVGVMAQELEENPVTAPSVITKEDGHKEVDIKELTMENTAVIADLVRRVQKLEENR